MLLLEPFVKMVLEEMLLFDAPAKRTIPKPLEVPLVNIVLLNTRLLFTEVRLIPYPLLPDALISRMMQFLIVIFVRLNAVTPNANELPFAS